MRREEVAPSPAMRRPKDFARLERSLSTNSTANAPPLPRHHR